MFNFFRILALLVLQISLVGCSSTPGDSAFQSGNYRLAVEMYKKQYRAGNEDGGLRLAGLYSMATSGFYNPEAAFSIYRELSQRENILAAYNIGVCYEYGKGTSVDYKKAEYWYRFASDRGYLYAIYNLGSLYANKHIQPPNDIEGLALLLEAANLAKGNDTSARFIREDLGGHIREMTNRMPTNQVMEARRLAGARAAAFVKAPLPDIPPLVRADGSLR